jgi:hypothetical protein
MNLLLSETEWVPITITNVTINHYKQTLSVSLLSLWNLQIKASIHRPNLASLHFFHSPFNIVRGFFNRFSLSYTFFFTISIFTTQTKLGIIITIYSSSSSSLTHSRRESYMKNKLFQQWEMKTWRKPLRFHKFQLSLYYCIIWYCNC